jgi:DNA-binding protein HU-beta
MSKSFIASVIAAEGDVSMTRAGAITTSLLEAIVKELRVKGTFTLPTFGSFRVAQRKARKALNPRTGEPIQVAASSTVKFKASPSLKKRTAPVPRKSRAKG